MSIVDSYAPTVETYFLEEDMELIIKIERVLVIEEGEELQTAIVGLDHYGQRKVYKGQSFSEWDFCIVDGAVDEDAIDCVVSMFKEEYQAEKRENYIFQFVTWGINKMRKSDMKTIVPLEVNRE